MTSVLLATSSDWPDLFADDQPLQQALVDRGIEARAAIWDDQSVDWGAADMVVLRSIWDYTWKRDEFVRWAHAVERTTPLHNPARIVEWNSHKRYLRDLEQQGVPIVPTAWVDAGSSIDVRALAESRGWNEIVVKPCVSAGARRTVRGSAAGAQRHVDTLVGEHDLMVQPYVAETERDGEHALVHVEGSLSHVVRKDPALATADYSSSRVSSAQPHPDEVRLARRVLDIVGPLLYARVDTVVVEGCAHLMELELIEPQLFLRTAPGTTARLAGAVVRALETV